MASVARQDEATAIVEKQLQQHRHFTLTEAAAMTGLSIDDTRDALDALITTYICRLQVSENGDLIYHFGDSLRRRGEKTSAEKMEAIAEWLWKVFTVVYKAWIAVTLVVYFVIFIVLLIIVVIASSARQSSDSSDRRRSSSSVNFGLILHLFSSIFHWRTVTGSVDYVQDRQGYRYRHYQSEPSALNANKKSFIAAVYDFVFGPPRVESDPLQNEKETAAYLRQQKGIVTASELSALAGWNFPQAETFLTDCVIRYRGDTKISENAVLYGQFDTITRGVGEAEDGEIVYYWDEYEPEYELTGNSSMYNLLIVFMNSFNLIFSILVLSGSFSGLLEAAPGNQFVAAANSMVSNGPFFTVFLGWFPLVFSILFFVIPVVRLFKIQTLQRQRHHQNIRKRLFKAIFAPQGRPQTVVEVLASANQNTQEETLSQPVVEEMMQELSLDMPGDMLVNEAAAVQFTFPRITAELQEVHRIRQQRRHDDSLGDIIVDSE